MNIIQGNALTELAKLSAESIDLCLTGPPFYRTEYWDNPQAIWDSKEGCDHDFSIPCDMRVQNGRNVDDAAFCSKCNAWRGHLGLEPSVEMYAKHLTSVFDEVKRVLKEPGACWVILEDTRDRETDCYCMAPEYFTIEMIRHGWVLRSQIIMRNKLFQEIKPWNTLVEYYDILFFTKSRERFPSFKSDYESVINDELKGCNLIHNHSSPEGTILDPFTGKGTVAMAAKLTGRNFIGIELNEGRRKIALQKIRGHGN